jgi:hypothetical protein
MAGERDTASRYDDHDDRDCAEDVKAKLGKGSAVLGKYFKDDVAKGRQ